MREQINRLALQHSARMREIRRYLHQNPELSGQEYRTTEFVADTLGNLGLSPTVAKDQRGLFVDIGDRRDHPSIAIRADIDALPIQTSLQTGYASRSPGVMHACGHDAHTAIVLGVALILCDLQQNCLELPTVRLVFQPEEETSRGAKHMLECGAYAGIGGALALHVDPARRVGTVGVRDGAFTAGCDVFDCRFHGAGGHGARPHLTADIVGASAQWVTDVYRRVPRSADPRDAVVVNVGTLHSGVASNVVPPTATLTGTLRSLSSVSSEQARARMREISDAVASTHGCQVDLSFNQHTPPLENAAGMTQRLRTAAITLLGRQHVREIVRPSMGAEDFAFVGRQIPAAMFRLGVASTERGHAPLHTPAFDIDEESLSIGASMLTLAAVQSPTNTDHDSAHQEITQTVL